MAARAIEGAERVEELLLRACQGKYMYTGSMIQGPGGHRALIQDHSSCSLTSMHRSTVAIVCTSLPTSLRTGCHSGEICHISYHTRKQQKTCWLKH